jgi:hypothetical protein
VFTLPSGELCVVMDLTLVVMPGAAVLRIFAITGLDQVFPSFASLEEALAQVPGNG